jgi:hypothetical protein
VLRKASVLPIAFRGGGSGGVGGVGGVGGGRDTVGGGVASVGGHVGGCGGVTSGTGGSSSRTFIAQVGPARAAWFKDPDGNVFGVREGPVPGAGLGSRLVVSRR